MSAVGEERSADGAAAAVEPAALVEPDRSWHGPTSVAGSVVGSLGVLLMVALAGTPYAVPHAMQYALPWALGLPMLLGHGPVRRFGVGLVASGLMLPAVPAMILLVAAAFGSD